MSAQVEIEEELSLESSDKVCHVICGWCYELDNAFIAYCGAYKPVLCRPKNMFTVLDIPDHCSGCKKPRCEECTKIFRTAKCKGCGY